MANKLWTDWYDELLPDVPGCNETIASYAIKRAAIEFCERSQVYQAAVPDVASVNGTSEYALPDVASGVIATQLLELWYYNGTTTVRLKYRTPRQLTGLYGPAVNWRTAIGTGQLYFTQEMPGKVRIAQVPNASQANALTRMWAAARPKDDATGIDELIGIPYWRAIGYGAKRELMGSPKKPYTNPDLAAFNGQLFEVAIKEAQVRAFQARRGRSRTEADVQ